MRIFILIFLLSAITPIISQDRLTLHFNWNNSRIEEKSIEITQLKYYISSISLQQDNQSVFIEESSYHLIDHSDSNSTFISLELPKNLSFDKILFNIGVDSAKNMKGVHGGDLDPTNGMYWTWQSGYINFKLEAKESDHELSYHIGGFMYPNNACRKVELSVWKLAQAIEIEVNPELLLDKIDTDQLSHVMSPGKTAMNLADILPSLFSIEQ